MDYEPYETDSDRRKRRRRSGDTIDFEITRVQNGPGEYAAVCFRASTLYRLFPPTGRQYEHEGFIATQTQRLIELRRRQFMAIRQIAPDLLRGHAWTVNCPPFGVFTDESTHCCRLDYLCPFCWSRGYIKPVIEQMLVCFPEADKAVRVKDPDACRQQLAANGKRILLYQAAKDVSADGDLHDHLEHESWCLRGQNKTRKGKKKGPFGSLTLSLVEPSQVYDGGWRIIRRRLTVVPAAEADPSPTSCDPEFPETPPEKIVCVQTGDILRAVAITLRYPEWLMTGDPKKVVQWLTARKGIRLLNKCGKLRRSH